MQTDSDFDTRRAIELSSNAYSMVNDIVREARSIYEKSNYRILQSQAITHAVNHTQPDIYDITRTNDEYEAKAIKEAFCYIDDIEIKHAVYDSFYDSKKARELVFVYNDIADESRRTRVRVLTRMLYHKLLNYIGGGKQMAKKKVESVETVEAVQEVKQDVVESAAKEEAPKETAKKGTRKAASTAKVEVAPEVPAVEETVKESTAGDSAKAVAEPSEQLASETKADDAPAKKSEKAEKAKPKKSAKSGYAIGDIVKTDLARLHANSVCAASIRPIIGEFVICVDGEHDGRVAVSENGVQIGWISVDEIKK